MQTLGLPNTAASGNVATTFTSLQDLWGRQVPPAESGVTGGSLDVM
jgi:hypothetical protein